MTHFDPANGPASSVSNGPAADGIGLLHSPWFGEVRWDETSEVSFPAGLPGFDDCRRMIAIEIPSHRPVLYLQSVDRPTVCFMTLPVQYVSPGFTARLNEDDAAALARRPGELPGAGSLLWLAMVVPTPTGAIANLDAPIVVDVTSGVGIQTSLAVGQSDDSTRKSPCVEAVC